MDIGERCDVPGGLVIEDPSFFSIRVTAGNLVYIVQAGGHPAHQQVTLERSTARRLAAALLASLDDGS